MAITLFIGVFRSWRDMRSTSSRRRTLFFSSSSCARRSVMSVVAAIQRVTKPFSSRVAMPFTSTQT